MARKETWIRVVTYQGNSTDPADQQKYMDFTAETVVPILQKTEGCTLGYWGEDPTTGQMAAVTYWTSQEAIDAAKPSLAQLKTAREELGMVQTGEYNFSLARVSPFSAW